MSAVDPALERSISPVSGAGARSGELDESAAESCTDSAVAESNVNSSVADTSVADPSVADPTVAASALTDSAPTAATSATSEEAELERRLVKQLRSGRAALPVLPKAASMALRLANDPAASIEELAQLVELDPPIAARFMSVANSAMYWRGHRTGSTHAAIVRLGLAYTRDLLFQAVYAASSTGLKRFQREVQEVFHRSVICAFASRIIAEELKLDGEYAYMCGLLHDIGEARIYRVLAELPRFRLGKGVLKALVARHHCDAGAEVAMAWRLPTEIVDACAAHHNAESREAPHVRLVMIADQVAAAVRGDEARMHVIEANVAELGVSALLIRRIIARTREATKGL